MSDYAGTGGRPPFAFDRRPDAAPRMKTRSLTAGQGAWWKALAPLNGVDAPPDEALERLWAALAKWPPEVRINPHWVDWHSPSWLWSLMDHAVFPSHYRTGKPRMGAAGAQALAAAAHIPRLTVAQFPNERLGDAGVIALAAVSQLAGVGELRLAGNGIGDAGAAALAASPNLSALQRLDLRNNSVGDEGAVALASASGLSALRKLNLYDNSVGDEGAVAFANASGLGGLQSLNLRGNPIGVLGEKALAAGTLHGRVGVGPKR